MIDIILVFSMGSGLQLRLPATFEEKHYRSDVIEEVAEALAKKMGVFYLYWVELNGRKN